MLALMKMLKKIWCEAVVSTATKLDNIMVKHMGGKSSYAMFFKEHQNYRNYLRLF